MPPGADRVFSRPGRASMTHKRACWSSAARLFCNRHNAREQTNCFDGERFQAIRPAFSRSIESFGGGWLQFALQDRAGDWWFATGSGLAQFPRIGNPARLAGASPKAIYE